MLFNPDKDFDKLLELQAKVLKHIISGIRKTPIEIVETKKEITRLSKLMRQFMKDLKAEHKVFMDSY